MLINTKKSNIKTKNPTTPVYYITFEDYLKPNKVHKATKPILLANKSNNKHKPELRLKLLEHPVLVAGHKSKWQMFKDNLKHILRKTKENLRSILPKTQKDNRQAFLKTPQKVNEKPLGCCAKQNQKIVKFVTKWHNKTFAKNRVQNVQQQSIFSRFNTIKLPKFLSFLRARNDDGLCKRKSGFEIYCEMASIHGFINFVGSTTGQRAFWSFTIFVAIAMSGFILLLSYFLNSSTPTIFYTESTQYPTWAIPLPAVTICSLNRISKNKAQLLAERFHNNSNLTMPEINRLFRLAFYDSENINSTQKETQMLGEILKLNGMSLHELQESLTPNCETALLRCKFKGRFERCDALFEKVRTSYGPCCSFNSNTLKRHFCKRTDFQNNEDVEYITSSGHQTGLIVLLNAAVEDYQMARRKVPGYQVFINDAYDFTDNNALHSIITPKTINHLSITPQQTYASNYIESSDLLSRRCYLPNERQLFHFGSYSQPNCLAECRSSKLYEKCRCTLGNWPKKGNWSVCGLMERECVLKNKALYTSALESAQVDYRNNHNAESFICDCYPLCDFNMYTVYSDAGVLDRQYSSTEKRLFKDINITNQILLHVYYGTLYAERLRLDVYENWLTFIGTFGGITGLFMGYSFVSGFELIFFVFVRPACNWLTKQQIRYRIQRRAKKAKAEMERKRTMKEEQEKQDRIEAYLRMRPYCPGY